MLLLALFSETARADSASIGDECNGRRGATYVECPGRGYGVVACVPNRCKTDADCIDDNATCQEVQACIDPNGSCGGATSGMMSSIETLNGECDAEQKCFGDAVCQTEHLCVRRTLEDDGGCSVSAPSWRRSPAWVWMLLASALLIQVRSRRR